jgi:hypothetical protein
MTFQLMRELRAAGRSLVREREVWQHWSPTAAQLALQELRPLTDFVDVVRARALSASTKPPSDLASN